MKICMLSSFYHPMTAGSEVYTKEISERLAADGHEVHVVTGRWGKLKSKETINGVRVHRVPSILISNLALPSVTPGMMIKGLQIAKDSDLIHAHLAFPPGFVGAKIKKITGKPLVTMVQGGDMGIYPESGLGRFWGVVKPCITYGLKNSEVVTSISTYLSEKAQELGAKDIVMVRNGTDTDKFNPDIIFDDIVKKYSILGSPIILTVSRLVPKNGTDILIEAFSDVLKDFPNAKLIVIGDGVQRKELEEQARVLGNSVLFLGHIPHEEIPKFMNLSNVFTRVSLDEGLGIVFTEAMACKTPVVATAVGGIPDIIDDHVHGLLVPPSDPTATAKALREVLENKKLRDKIIEKAYSRVSNEFAWDSIYQNTLKVYGLAIEKNKKQR